MRKWPLEGRLFVLLVLVEAAVALWLVGDDRIMRGHDTFVSFARGYFSWCHASQGGGMVQWLPWNGGGMPSWYLPQSFAPAELFPPAGALLDGASALAVFHLLIFLEELLFLSGLWLLARRFYRSPWTVFFVCLSAAGSCLWLDQMGFNLRMYSGLPLALAWGHDFLERGTRWKAFLAVLLMSLFVTLNYSILLTGFVILLYFVLYALVYRRRPELWGARLRPRRTDLAWVAAALVPMAIAWIISKPPVTATGFREGRGAGAVVEAESYLTYGGHLSPVRYLDFLAGLTPSLDFSLYCGILAAVLAVLAPFVRPGRRTIHLALCMLAVLLFSAGYLSLVGPVSFLGFPLLAYYRHVALAAAFVKLFVILLAGVGFDAVLAGRVRRPLLLAAAAASLTLAGLLATAGMSGEDTVRGLARLMETARAGLISFQDDLVKDALGSRLLLTSAAGALAASLTLFAATPLRRRPVLLAALLLAGHGAALYAWKVQISAAKTIALGPERAKYLTIGPLPWRPRRTTDRSTSPRYAAFRDIHPYGTQSDLENLFFCIDAVDPERVARPAEAKAFAVSVDRIRFFSRAHRTEGIPDLLEHPDASGDLLLLPGDGPPPDPASSDVTEGRAEVVSFDANHLRLRAEVDGPAWLLYADRWHAGWSATVNGRETRVERANQRWKAVALEPGASDVEFRFRQRPRRAWLLRFTAVNQLLWMIVPVVLAVRVAAGRGSIPS